MIKVDSLCKQFGATVALDNLSFEVTKGEILGFLGPNGAGKTTTIRILTGFLSPTAGSVSIAGIDVQDKPLQARSHIGYLPESVPVYGEMTVMEYLTFVANMKSVPARERKTHLQRIIDQSGLQKVQSRLSGHLSKGYRQRLGLAQALIGDPDVLILDEPTSGLDPKQIIEIRELIRQLGGDRTIILSSHILPEVSHICERVIILNQGKLIAVDSPDRLEQNASNSQEIFIELSDEVSSEHLREVLQNLPDVTSIEKISDTGARSSRFLIQTDSSDEARPLVAKFILNANLGLLEIRKETKSLEDIFIRLVADEEVSQ